MEVIDGENTVFEFNGVEVKGVRTYTFFQGQPRPVAHRPLKADAAQYLPGLPDYGVSVLALYRDHSDPGQDELRLSLKNRQVVPCRLILEDGTVKTFQGFCEVLPVAGGKLATQNVNTSNATIRITGPVETGGGSIS